MLPSEEMVQQAVKSLEGRQFVGVLHIQRATGLSYAMARFVIDDLVDRGYLRRVYGAEGPYRVCKGKEARGG